MTTSVSNLWLNKNKFFTKDMYQLFNPSYNPSNVGSDLLTTVRLQNINRNANTDDIETLLKSNDSETIIKGLLNKKNQLRVAKISIEKYLEQMNYRKYLEYTRSDNPKLRLIVDNLTLSGAPIKNANMLPTFSTANLTVEPNKVIDVFNNTRNKLSSSNRSYYDNNKDNINQAILDNIYWKKVDNTRHTLGNPVDVISLIVRVAERYLTGNSSGLGSTDDLLFLQNIFKHYIPSNRQNEFKFFLENDVEIPQNLNIYPVDTETNNGTYRLGEVDSNNLLINLNDAFKNLRMSAGQEYIVLFLVNMLGLTIGIYRNVYKKLISMGINKKRVEWAIDDLEQYFMQCVALFYQLDDRYIKYGIGKSNDLQQEAVASIDGTGHYRIIGKVNNVIGNKTNLQSNLYPFVLDTNNNLKLHETKTRFKEFIMMGNLPVGGMILSSQVDQMVFKILRQHFSDILIIKDKLLALVERTLKISRSHLHMNDLIDMANSLKRELDKTISYANKNSRNLGFKTFTRNVMNQYVKYREKQIGDYLRLQRFNTLIKKYDISKPRNLEIVKESLGVPEGISNMEFQEKLLSSKETMELAFYHSMLLATAYKSLALKLVSLAIRDYGTTIVSNDYLQILQSAFISTDNQLLNGVSDASIKGSLINTFKTPIINTGNSSSVNFKLASPGSLTNVGRSNKQNRLKNSVNIGNVGEALTREWWVQLYSKLDNKSLYLPYVSTLGTNGLINIIAAGIDGEINMDNMSISGIRLTKNKYSSNIKRDGLILITDDISNINKTSQWRAINQSELNKISKYNSEDIRRFLFNLINNRENYMKLTSNQWSGIGYRNLVSYCLPLTTSNSNCPILISRDNII